MTGESENYYLGLTRTDRTRKLAFHTVKRLVGLLDTGRLTVADAELAVEVTAGAKGRCTTTCSCARTAGRC